MNTVAIVGAFTALFAATMGLAANDLKRVLAFSTVSQLGYMMFALGIGAYGAAVFHLFTHAFFKALLFLGAGSVAHATGNTFDMRYMGGLRKVMPWTYATFLIGGLSLAGIFPLSGFWSKDEILAHGLAHFEGVTTIVLWLPMVAVAVTAVYIARAIVMTFEGEFRGGSDVDPDLAEPREVHLAESPWVMVAPLALLAVAAAAIGFLANPIVDLGRNRQALDAALPPDGRRGVRGRFRRCFVGRRDSDICGGLLGVRPEAGLGATHGFSPRPRPYHTPAQGTTLTSCMKS